METFQLKKGEGEGEACEGCHDKGPPTEMCCLTILGADILSRSSESMNMREGCVQAFLFSLEMAVFSPHTVFLQACLRVRMPPFCKDPSYAGLCSP